MLISKKHKSNGLDLSPLFATDDEQLMWEYVQMAHFLNMGYEAVKDMPFDEFEVLKRLKQIHDYSKTKEGIEILKDNIRYTCTSPDVDKLRKKYGKEENNGEFRFRNS